jgi:hypothetical protein
LLNTPAGKVAQQLIKDGVRIGISSRGLGSLKECDDSPGKQEVQEDYKMVTFDLVADPSTRGAFPSVSESTQLLKQKTKQQALRENVFVTLLKNKLDLKYKPEEIMEEIDVEEVSDADLLAFKIDKLINRYKK